MMTLETHPWTYPYFEPLMPLYRVLLPHYDSDRYPYITTGRDIMPDYVTMRHLPVRVLELCDQFS